MRPVLDQITGVKDRTLDLEGFLKAKDYAEWVKPKGSNLFGRITPTIDFVNEQRRQQLWLYNRRMLTGPATEVLAMDDNNNVYHGINFASADYLGLAQNESAKEAAIQAARQFGVNSAGSPLAFGATK